MLVSKKLNKNADKKDDIIGRIEEEGETSMSND